MKLSTTELHGLLHEAPPAAGGRVLPTPPFVRACCITLWQKVPPGTLTKKMAREKLLDSLDWLARQHGWVLSTNVPQKYRTANGLVDGRVHATLQGGGVTLVLELCFELQDAALLKLWAARTEGKQVLLLWAGVTLPDAVFRGKLSAACKTSPVDWLPYVQLNAPILKRP